MAINFAAVLEIRQADEVSEYPLTQPVTTIGRSEDNQVVLKSNLVSRYHARLELVEGVQNIYDLGSSNGTVVNGIEIEPRVPHSIKEGDIIGIGGFTLTFRMASPAGKTPVSTAESKTVIPARESLTFLFPSIQTLVVTTSQGTKEFPLTQDTLTIGRDPANDIVISDGAVSRSHARLHRTPHGYQITDLNSTNGLTFESNRISEKQLADGDVLWITDSISLTYKAPVMAEIPEPETSAAPEKLDVKGRATITIGRSEDNDIVFSHPAVSRRHARVVRRDPDGVYLIEDLGSSNGTFINGEKVVQPRQLKRGDTIRVGPIKLIYSPEAFEKIDESSNLRVDAIQLNQFVSQNVNLLQNISLSIQPNEFVTIVGGSGSGKSTLLKALTGFIPASNGSVLINGDDLYANFDAHRSQFGYVPQEDIIHKELTVYEALDYSAKLRLPADMSPGDRHQRINEVLATLDLTERKNLPIRKLSGGQLKRVSIGVELLTNPGLFCLDEATSGLDPGIESQMMRLFRKLCDQGHTILLVTHATQNVMLCDQVIFLARGGYLAYYGPPDDALRYFGVEDFNVIYEKLERDQTPRAWAEHYLHSAQYQEYVAARLPERSAALVEGERRAASPGSQVKQISSLAQFLVLSRRNLNILFRDRFSLVLMLLLAPIVGLFEFLLWQPGLLDPVGGDPRKVITNLFMAAMIGCLVGSLSSMREIVKETDIYRRERMVALKIFPYILSKLAVAVPVAMYQAAVLILFMKIAGGYPGAAEFIPTYITLTLAVFAAMLLGLFVSAISPNQNVTPLLLVIVLVPQLLFGGIIPLVQLGGAAQTLGNLATTKWAFESLVTISGMGKDIADDPCWQMSEEEREELTDEEKEKQCNCMGVSIFKDCNFPGIHDFYNPAIDQPEPEEPIHPGDPPPQPEEPPSKPGGGPPAHPGAPPRKPDESLLLINPIYYWQQMEAWNAAMAVWQHRMTQYANAMKAWEAEQTKWGSEMKAWEKVMAKYQDDLKIYQDLVQKYQDEMEVWQTEMQEWKKSRSKAVSSAEATMGNYYEKWGSAFNVNVKSHWIWMMVIMAVNLGLVFGIMKWRDTRRR